MSFQARSWLFAPGDSERKMENSIAGIELGSTNVIRLVTETPEGMFTSGDYKGVAQAGGIGRVSAFAASSFDSTYMGGTGGQVDYVRAGARSPGSGAFIALPATAKGGKLSRITTLLSGPVMTARSKVDVIVTEFGATELKGCSIGERAKRLVGIAHPDFREDLNRAAHTLAQRGF